MIALHLSLGGVVSCVKNWALNSIYVLARRCGRGWEGEGRDGSLHQSSLCTETDLKDSCLLAATWMAILKQVKMVTLACFLLNGSALILLPQNWSQWPWETGTTLAPRLHRFVFSLPFHVPRRTYHLHLNGRMAPPTLDQMPHLPPHASCVLPQCTWAL